MRRSPNVLYAGDAMEWVVGHSPEGAEVRTPARVLRLGEEGVEVGWFSDLENTVIASRSTLPYPPEGAWRDAR